MFAMCTFTGTGLRLHSTQMKLEIQGFPAVITTIKTRSITLDAILVVNTFSFKEALRSCHTYTDIFENVDFFSVFEQN